MDAVEYQRTIARLCLNAKCGNCPIWLARKDKSRGCKFFLIDYPEEAVALIQKWAEENPQKTMMQDFFEKYPNAMKDGLGAPMICPHHLGHPEYRSCETEYHGEQCYTCWNRPLEDE